MLLTISVVNKHMVSHKRSITAESESNTSFLNPIERICFQICSIGFISGVYDGMERSCIFSGQRNVFDLCHAAPSYTNRIISSGYLPDFFYFFSFISQHQYTQTAADVFVFRCRFLYFNRFVLSFCYLKTLHFSSPFPL